MSTNRSQDSYLRTGPDNSLRVRGEGNNWWIEGTDNNGVWVDAEPSRRYPTADEAAAAMEELAKSRHEEREREFLEGFAEGAEIRARDARDAWAQFTRQMSDQGRVEEELRGRARGHALGLEYKAL